MKIEQKTITVKTGEYLGPVDWNYDFSSHGWDYGGSVNPEIVKDSLKYFKEVKVNDLVLIYGIYEKVVRIGMYDGGPYWKPVPSVSILSPISHGEEWFPFYKVRGVRHESSISR